MILTGKCREDFEKWYYKKYCSSSMKYKELLPHHKEDVFGWFYNLDMSFKFGVYVDFFDSMNISIEINNYSTSDGFTFAFTIYNNIYNRTPSNNCWISRPEARTEAIKKANEIVNSKK